MVRSLRDSWTLGGLTIPNRVVLAPLAGIGNWFVRLQAKRYGAGLAVSEMVSSFAVHYGNPKTCTELLRIHPGEREGGPVSVQLFGHDPDVMRSAAATVARAGADIIDLNMGCPVPKVCKTGAGAALGRDRCRGAHHVRVPAEQLDRDRPAGALLGAHDEQLVERLAVAVVDRVARDHLRHREAGAVALGLEAHEPVADAGQRREHDPVRDRDPAELPGIR